MTAQSATLMRCERCRAVISSAEASELIRGGAPCGFCGGPLALHDGPRAPAAARDSPSAERRLLGALRRAGERPVGARELARAGIDDPAGAIFELERAGHRIERAFGDGGPGRRRFLGYRLGADGRPGSQPSSSR